MRTAIHTFSPALLQWSRFPKEAEGESDDGPERDE